MVHGPVVDPGAHGGAWGCGDHPADGGQCAADTASDDGFRGSGAATTSRRLLPLPRRRRQQQRRHPRRTSARPLRRSRRREKSALNRSRSRLAAGGIVPALTEASRAVWKPRPRRPRRHPCPRPRLRLRRASAATSRPAERLQGCETDLSGHRAVGQGAGHRHHRERRSGPAVRWRKRRCFDLIPLLRCGGPRRRQTMGVHADPAQRRAGAGHHDGLTVNFSRCSNRSYREIERVCRRA